MLNVRIHEDLNRELSALSEYTNRTKSFYVCQAIEEYILDYLDVLDVEEYRREEA